MGPDKSHRAKPTELPVCFDWVEEKLPASFKVEYFQHVSDHGPRVEWEPGTLVHSWFERLRSVRNGKMQFSIRDKKSTLTVLIMERIWMTCWSHNSGTVRTVHYDHPQISQSRVVDKDGFDQIVLSMFGAVPKLRVAAATGEPKPSEHALDVAQSYIEYAAFRAGWNGARALVVDRELEVRNKGVGVLRASLSALRVERDYLDSSKVSMIKDAARAARKPYGGIKMHREICAKADYVLKAASTGFERWPWLLMDTKLQALLNAAAGDKHKAALRMTSYGKREIDLQLPPDQQPACIERARPVVMIIDAQDEAYHPELRSPTHTVCREAGKPVLSSGVALPFEESALLQWLEEGAEHPFDTRYGPLTKVKATVMDNGVPRAAVLLEVGCHLVDVAADLGGSYAKLLAPDFEPVRVAATEAMSEQHDPGVAAVVNGALRAELIQRLHDLKPWLKQTQRRALVRVQGAVRDARAYHAIKQQKVKELNALIADRMAEMVKAVKEVREWHAGIGGVSLQSFAQSTHRLLVECQPCYLMQSVKSNSPPEIPEGYGQQQ